jgi:lipopolysaccharide export system protein LptA
MKFATVVILTVTIMVAGSVSAAPKETNGQKRSSAISSPAKKQVKNKGSKQSPKTTRGKNSQKSSGIATKASPATPDTDANSSDDLTGLDIGENMGKLPTYIRSDNLTVNNQDRTFTYSGNVEVTQGDLILTSNNLQGKYDKDNQITQITARQNVTIVKGEGIRATGELAVYDRANDTIVLTDNPELKQGASVLTADRIRIFLKENRSVAEGQVRVKVVRDDKGPNGASPASLIGR